MPNASVFIISASYICLFLFFIYLNVLNSALPHLSSALYHILLRIILKYMQLSPDVDR
jgi:hypothetical protein